MSEVIKTWELTINKKVKAKIKELFTNIRLISYKRHVPGIGYVLYIKDFNGKKLCNVYKEQGQILIHI